MKRLSLRLVKGMMMRRYVMGKMVVAVVDDTSAAVLHCASLNGHWLAADSAEKRPGTGQRHS